MTIRDLDALLRTEPIISPEQACALIALEAALPPSRSVFWICKCGESFMNAHMAFLHRNGEMHHVRPITPREAQNEVQAAN